MAVTPVAAAPDTVTVTPVPQRGGPGGPAALPPTRPGAPGRRAGGAWRRAGRRRHPATHPGQPGPAAGHPVPASGAVAAAAQHGLRRRSPVHLLRPHGARASAPRRGPAGQLRVLLLGLPRAVPRGGRLPQRAGRAHRGPDAQPGRDALDHRVALLHEPPPVQRADRVVCGAALLGVRVGDLPGQLRHLRRDLPVPPGPRGVDHGPHRGVPVARLLARCSGGRARGRGQVRRPAVRAHHRRPARAGGLAAARPQGASLPARFRRRGRGPALRGAAPGRPLLYDGHLEYHDATCAGRDPGHHPA